MINVTIATKNFRFLFTVSEILNKIEGIKSNHILPDEPVPNNTDIIITTEIEKKQISGEHIFIPKSFNRYYLYSNILLKAQDRISFDLITIGIDPGKTTGVAIIAEDEVIVGVGEFFTAVDVVKEVISAYFNIETIKFEIKVGAGGVIVRDDIIKRLKGIFHENVSIKIENEDISESWRFGTFLLDVQPDGRR